MRRHLALAAICLPALLLAGCGDKDENQEEERVELTLIGGPVTEAQTDVGAPGSSVGELRTFTRELTTESGEPAGEVEGTAVISQRRGSGQQLEEHRTSTVQLTLDEGDLVLAGVWVPRPTGPAVPHPRGVRLAIVGGTGEYRGARGETVQTPLSGGRLEIEADFHVPAD